MSVLRPGGRAAYTNGVVSAIGLVFLVALYASFEVGATSIGLAFFGAVAVIVGRRPAEASA